jgi:hypothetical protein
MMCSYFLYYRHQSEIFQFKASLIFLCEVKLNEIRYLQYLQIQIASIYIISFLLIVTDCAPMKYYEIRRPGWALISAQRKFNNT